MATYRRSLPRTLLPLDRWAQIIGIDPMHFRQVTFTDHTVRTCAQVWKQYSWQEADQISRYDVADAIQRAENVFAQYLGYKLLPTWEASEQHLLNKPGNAELLFRGSYSNQGFKRSVNTNWGHVLVGGIEAKSLIEAAVAITYSDEDGDGYDETATVTVATSVTDDEEIAVYYPSEGGADEWEIRPLRNVSISGGVATITMWRHQLVDPDLVEALNPEAVNGDTDASFLTTVDIYRHYNDISTEGVIYWFPNALSCCCDSSSTCCPVCDKAEQDACLNVKVAEAGLVMFQPASYDDDDAEWDSADPTCCRAPDMIALNYRAGFQNQKLSQPTLQMDPQWERMVAYYALALLDRDLCGCDPAKALAMRMKEDFAKSGLQSTDRMLENPLGTTRAAWMAWNMVSNEQNRIIGHAVRW